MERLDYVADDLVVAALFEFIRSQVLVVGIEQAAGIDIVNYEVTRDFVHEMQVPLAHSAVQYESTGRFRVP